MDSFYDDHENLKHLQYAAQGKCVYVYSLHMYIARVVWMLVARHI